jgi:NAD(P)-dependent dehydrogenase (short-subunit alcohol dehydrogenase family)
MNEKLTDQRVVVVGGSAGIGYEVARLALEQGARVTVLGRSAERLDAAVASLGDRAEGVVADAGDEAQVRAAFGALERVDHVYVAAGTARLGGILDDGPVEEQMRSFVERVWGSVYVVRAVAGKIAAGGSVTFTGGLSTDRPVPGAWVSGVGTATAEQLARVLALELAPVRFNAVSPGYTDTPMWDRILGENKQAVLAGVAEKLPVKRIATAAEVAEAVLLLMTNRSITGEVLHVDGGARLI